MFRAFSLFCLFALLFSTGAAAPIPKEPKPTPYFPTRVGYKWVTSSSWTNSITHSVTQLEQKTHIVTKVEQKDLQTFVTVCTERNGKLSSEAVMLITAKGLFVPEAANEKLDTPICALKLPPKPGERWDTKFTLAGSTIETQYETLEPEEVKVPAGKFKAIPVKTKSTVTTQFTKLTLTQEKTIWFAPGIGVVKVEDKDPGATTVDVLESFTPGKE
jgi:hypothetical protein